MLLCFPFSLDTIHQFNYILDFTCLTIGLMILIHMLDEYEKRFSTLTMEPIVVFSAIYFSLYFAAPMVDIATGNLLWFGVDLFSTGIQSTLVAMSGYVAFVVGYATSRKTTVNSNSRVQFRKIVSNRNLDMIIMIVWLVSTAGFALYLSMYYGFSIRYILSIGMSGIDSTGNIISRSYGFLMMFAYSMVTATLLYFEYGRSRIVKFSMITVLLLMQTTWGFRFILLQTVISFVVYFSLRSGRKMRPRDMILGVLGALILILLMTMFRDSIRLGKGADFSSISFDGIFVALREAVWDNLRIYNNFYAVVKSIPSSYPFVYFKEVVVGTLTMLIPRSIWPLKPDPRAGISLYILASSASMQNSGQAYPNLGEYYYAFGVFGVLVFMFIYGRWMRALRLRFLSLSDRSGFDRVAYASLISMNVQCIIRGYIPSNFYMVLFAGLPLLIVLLLASREPAASADRDIK